MARSRAARLVGPCVRLALFAIATIAAVRFLYGTVASRGWGPGALFGLLLIAGGIALVWRATLDLRKALGRT